MSKKYLLLLFQLLILVPNYMSSKNTENKFVLVIDAGHGGKDPGGKGKYIREKDLVLNIALLFGNEVEKNCPDVKVIYTRKTDKFIELSKRADIANKAKANLFVCIHADCAANSSAYGISTFTLGEHRSNENLKVAQRENKVIQLEKDYQTEYKGFDPNSAESYIMFNFMQDNYINQSVNFASLLQEESRKDGRLDRGVRQAGFLVLARTTMPSVLVELGFMTNRKEEKYMISSKGKKQMSHDLYKAFVNFKNKYYSIPKVIVENKDKEIDKTKRDKKYYKVQILSSSKKLSKKDKRLKNYNADYYYSNGLYKYTIGEFETFEKASKERLKLKKYFNDAFIVSFKEGKRVSVK